MPKCTCWYCCHYRAWRQALGRRNIKRLDELHEEIFERLANEALAHDILKLETIARREA